MEAATRILNLRARHVPHVHRNLSVSFFHRFAHYLDTGQIGLDRGTGSTRVKLAAAHADWMNDDVAANRNLAHLPTLVHIRRSLYAGTGIAATITATADDCYCYCYCRYCCCC